MTIYTLRGWDIFIELNSFTTLRWCNIQIQTSGQRGALPCFSSACIFVFYSECSARLPTFHFLTNYLVFVLHRIFLIAYLQSASTNMNETREEKKITGDSSDLASARSVVACMTFPQTPKVLCRYTLKNTSRWPSTPVEARKNFVGQKYLFFSGNNFFLLNLVRLMNHVLLSI